MPIVENKILENLHTPIGASKITLVGLKLKKDIRFYLNAVLLEGNKVGMVLMIGEAAEKLIDLLWFTEDISLDEMPKEYLVHFNSEDLFANRDPDEACSIIMGSICAAESLLRIEYNDANKERIIVNFVLTIGASVLTKELSIDSVNSQEIFEYK